MHPEGMFRVFMSQPIKLSRIQYRLAVELAAQEAAAAELKRQVSQQTGIPEDEVGVDTSADIEITTYPEIRINGVPLEWID
jgi:hypothetical protein